MIYFIGAGPGDPELLTIKAARVISFCEVIIYAGSLVNDEVLKYAREDAKIYNSAFMTLDEIIKIMEEAHKQGKNVARIHTGDPSIYGAVHEQMMELKKRDIPYEIIPGVSSFLAAASALKKELTIPGITQTIILTRIEGNTKMPEVESLRLLSKHRATMVIFLSVDKIERVVEELKEGYDPSTPVAVVYKASWEDEKVILGTLLDISEKVKKEGIKKTALILVGDFLKDIKAYSKLYDGKFSHGFRG
ncbi:precorrin-4 C(11)-methyltransferase [Caldanaerobacter sp.]|uniref:precorrin-4 C(11)-methyltransferase n=1 Tax=Caldanaerobacter sp. TaxID=2930036 RepID=UPI003C76003E